jgi:hypothetical protein
MPVTPEATLLMAEALKRIKLDGSFSPEKIGARIGLNKAQAESAARALSDAGVLVVGFDCASHFTSEFRKLHAPAQKSGRRKRAVRSMAIA